MLSLFPQLLVHFYLRNTALSSEQFMNHRRYFSETKSLMFKTKPRNCRFHPLSPSFGIVSLMAILGDTGLLKTVCQFWGLHKFLEKGNRWPQKSNEMLLFFYFTFEILFVVVLYYLAAVISVLPHRSGGCRYRGGGWSTLWQGSPSLGAVPSGGLGHKPRGRLLKADAPGRWQRANCRCHIRPDQTCGTSCIFSSGHFYE